MSRLFAGDVYEPDQDDERLLSQIARVLAAMHSREWITVREIAQITGDPENSIQAQIRHLRKRKHGMYDIPKRRRGGESSNDWEYHLGPRGAGIPQPHVCPRSRELAVALAELDPNHPLLH